MLLLDHWEQVYASVGPLGAGVCYCWTIGSRCMLVLGLGSRCMLVLDHREQVCARVGPLGAGVC